MLAAGRFVDC